MSATLTDRHIKTLTDLFAPHGQDSSLTWASVTRPEPSYYLTAADEREDARRRSDHHRGRPVAAATCAVCEQRKDVSAWAGRLAGGRAAAGRRGQGRL